MAETDGDKTEAPTPKRRQQAVEAGQIAKSPDLVAAALIVGSMLLLRSFGSDLVAALAALLKEMLSGRAFSDPSIASLSVEVRRALMMVGRALFPLLAGIVLIAAVGNMLQVGFRLNTDRLAPNLAALNPFAGVGRLFGGKSPMKALMSVLKFAVIGLVAWSAISNRIGQIIASPQLDFLGVFHLAGDVLFSIAMRIGMALLILAIADYAWQKWKLERDLKMTKQEVKDEMRSMEGDPKIKQRRRQVALAMLRNQLKKSVPTADVVVTNPTEFAVALKYDPDNMHAPRVVAKGQGAIAAQIRRLAVENGIPILERKPLARALYKLVEVGHEIPEEFYAAVAEILAYVYELGGKSRRVKQGV